MTDPSNHAKWEDTLRLGWGAEIREVDDNNEPLDYTAVFSPEQEAFSLAALRWYYSGGMGLSVKHETSARYKLIRDYIAVYCWNAPLVEGGGSPSGWVSAGVPADYPELLTLGPWRTRDQMRTASLAYLAESYVTRSGKRGVRQELNASASDSDNSVEADDLFGKENRVNIAWEDALARAEHIRRRGSDAAEGAVSPASTAAASAAATVASADGANAGAVAVARQSPTVGTAPAAGAAAAAASAEAARAGAVAVARPSPTVETAPAAGAAAAAASAEGAGAGAGVVSVSPRGEGWQKAAASAVQVATPTRQVRAGARAAARRPPLAAGPPQPQSIFQIAESNLEAAGGASHRTGRRAAALPSPSVMFGAGGDSEGSGEDGSHSGEENAANSSKDGGGSLFGSSDGESSAESSDGDEVDGEDKDGAGDAVEEEGTTDDDDDEDDDE